MTRSTEKMAQLLYDCQPHGLEELAAAAGLKPESAARNLRILCAKNHAFLFDGETARYNSLANSNEAILHAARKHLQDYPETHPERTKILEFIRHMEAKAAA